MLQQQALDLASGVIERYELTSAKDLLASCRSAASQDEIRIAIVGRFKAGKSSFLNHFLGQALLPVGAVPVTAVITELRAGPAERVEVRFLDGHTEEVRLPEIAGYVSERENAENHKSAAIVRIELPALAQFPGLIFVDTPGLESALAHNTQASLTWLPNVGLALVAISADHPVSQQDIELVRNLYRYTPNVSILLTKVDLVSAEDRSEVLDFIRRQLAKSFGSSPEMYPYSVHPGYDELREELGQKVIKCTLEDFASRRQATVSRKLDTLLAECSDYLTLSLKAATLVHSQREALKRQVIGEKEALADVKSELGLIVGHSIGMTRAATAALLEQHQPALEHDLCTEFDAKFPSWMKSLACLLSGFEDWMEQSLPPALTRISLAERVRLIEPLHKASKQVRRYLQEFRDRLSESTLRAFGTPLQTTEVEFEIREPETPDTRVGRVFDRNWELLSPVIPVMFIKSIVRRHLTRKISHLAYVNISRLTSQWEQSINAALLRIAKEAESRLDGLIATVEGLIETSSSDRVPALQSDLDRMTAVRERMAIEGSILS